MGTAGCRWEEEAIGEVANGRGSEGGGWGGRGDAPAGCAGTINAAAEAPGGTLAASYSALPGPAGIRSSFDSFAARRLRWGLMRPWFNPTPNLSPPSAMDRLLAGLVGVGLLVVGAAAALAAIVGWILLMIVVAVWGAHGVAAALVICLLIAMAGFGLAVIAAGLWSILQIGSVRRALGLRSQHP